MILLWILLIPFAAGIAGWILGRTSPLWPRALSLTAMTADLGMLVGVWIASASTGGGRWIAELDVPWVAPLGIGLHFAVDGLSLLLALLTAFLGIVAVLASWRGIHERVGFFHFNLMLVFLGVLGVFISLDLLLFVVFWEFMLVPMFYLIDIWGHENRHYAAVKFFLFTQLSGLLMLLAVLGLYFIHGSRTGTYTFDLQALTATPLSSAEESWLMLGFFIAFAVKLPVVPLHTWLPDAHTQAPTAGSVDLAGLLLKTGAYGMIRIILPLFPNAVSRFAPVFVILAAAGIIYGAFQAFGQRDLKRLIAYTSVSHLGFVLLGIFAGSRMAYQGAVLEMIAHGLSTGALFVFAGAVNDRIGTRDMEKMGGFWRTAPAMGGMTLFFALASLGLPGLGNFVAEILILLGSFRAFPAVTVVAVFGLVLATTYALSLVRSIFHGPQKDIAWLRENSGGFKTAGLKFPDLLPREMLIFGSMAALLLWLGLFPQPVLDLSVRLKEALPQIAALVTGGAP